MPLIVNADDLGYDHAASDAALRAHAEGLVSSATAMVFMGDSARAAAAALDQGLPTGLHLNLTEAFTAVDAPEPLRTLQGRVVAAFAPHLRLRRWVYDPRLKTDVERCISVQLTEFRRLYGRAPTHIDGHQHVHACLDVLLSPALRIAVPLRRVVIDRQGTAGPGRWRQRLAGRRFVSTDRFFALDELLAAEPESMLTAAAIRAVEVMVHPAAEHERALLEGEHWRQLRAPYALASYADLG